MSRQYGDSTVTLRTHLPTAGSQQPAELTQGPISAPTAGMGLGVNRHQSTASFFGEEGVERVDSAPNPAEVSRLTAEIERLKRKALSRGVNLTSKDEDVPTEDVAMLRQVFALADSTGDGFISKEELAQMHQVLGEPLSDDEVFPTATAPTASALVGERRGAAARSSSPRSRRWTPTAPAPSSSTTSFRGTPSRTRARECSPRRDRRLPLPLPSSITLDVCRPLFAARVRLRCGGASGNGVARAGVHDAL